jgi:hypothetical protein
MFEFTRCQDLTFDYPVQILRIEAHRGSKKLNYKRAEMVNSNINREKETALLFHRGDKILRGNGRKI